MKSIVLFGIILVLSISLISCSSNNAGQANQGTKKQQITTAQQNPSGSNTGIEVAPSSQQTGTEENLIDIQGEGRASSLHSIDFLDENTGWVIESVYQSDQQGSQLLMTQDGGRHWEVTKLDDMTLVQLMFIDKTIGWAIAQIESKTASGTLTYTMKILHTTDSGKSWDVQWEKKVDSAFNDGLWFEDTMHGYALVSGTLLFTGDGGKQWSEVSSGVSNFTPRQMSFADVDKGWLIGEIEQKPNSPSSDQNKETRLAVLRTTDGGRHWRKQFEKIYDYGPVGSIDIYFVNATTGWFLTSDSVTWNGELYYTANAGQDWKKINQIKCVRPAPTELDFITPELGWIPLEMGAGGGSGGLMLTRDGGKNFDIIDDFGEMSSISKVDLISREKGLAIGHSIYGDYIIRTVDGGETWTQVYPENRPTEDISFVDNQNGFGLGQISNSVALLHTSDGGDTWENIYSFTKGCNPSEISFISRDTGWVLAQQKETANAVILKTSDGGKTWITLDGGTPQIKGYSVDYMRFFNSDSSLLISKKADSTDLYRTQDGGRTWQVTEIKSEKGSINQFSFVSGKQGWETSASVGDKAVSLNKMIDGSTWVLLKQIGTDTHSYGIEFISEDRGWMLIEEPAYKSGSSKKLLFTADGGQTWSFCVFPKGFELETIRSQIPIQFVDDLHGWILTRYGLLKTEDGGRSWTFGSSKHSGESATGVNGTEDELIDIINRADSLDKLFDVYEQYTNRIDGVYAEAYGNDLLRFFRESGALDFIKALAARGWSFINVNSGLLAVEAFIQGGTDAVNTLEKDIEAIKSNTDLSSMELNTLSEILGALEQIQLANKTVYKAEKSDFTIWKGTKSISLKDMEDVKNLKGILGKPKSEKTEKLGPGSDTFNGSFVKKLSYEDIELQLFAPKGNETAFWIYDIIVTSKGFTTAKGIGVGDSISELKKLYPNIEAVKDGRQDENNCAYETNKSDEFSYLTFEIKGGEIVKIEMLVTFP